MNKETETEAGTGAGLVLLFIGLVVVWFIYSMAKPLFSDRHFVAMCLEGMGDKTSATQVRRAAEVEIVRSYERNGLSVYEFEGQYQNGRYFGGTTHCHGSTR